MKALKSSRPSVVVGSGSRTGSCLCTLFCSNSFAAGQSLVGERPRIFPLAEDRRSVRGRLERNDWHDRLFWSAL